jgi:RNA polymerase sigma-70 factor (ECF subfamily)
MSLERRPVANPAAIPDDALVRAARAGDREAFEILYDRHARAVRNQIRAKIADLASADDLHQDVWSRAWFRIDSLRDEGRFIQWIGQIAAHECIEWFRRNKRPHIPLTVLAGDGGDTTDPVAPPEPRPWEAREIRETVLRTIGECLDSWQQPLILRFIEGKSYAEIADALKRDVDQIRGILERGGKMLRQRLVRKGFYPGADQGVPGAGPATIEMESPARQHD